MEPHNGGLVIRPFAEGDLRRVLELIRTAIQAGAKSHYSEPQIAAWIRSESGGESGPHCRRLVADSGGEVAGFASADLKNTYQIRLIAVAPQYWRRGLGRKLLLCLEQFCAEGGIREIYLAASLNAVKFYEALGYTRRGRLTILLSPPAGVTEAPTQQAMEMAKSI